MPFVAGSTPTDSNGSRAGATGYAPGVGVVPAQMGTPTSDSSGQQSAPQIVQIAPGNATTGSSTALNDGVTTTLKATVAAFHNADHQYLGATANGLNVGGYTQLLSVDGYGDRQRETGLDGIPALGITTGAAQFAQQFLTTVPTTGTITGGGSTATITPASMTGIQVGAVLTVDTGANVENVVVTSLPSASTARIVPVNGAPTAPTFLFTHTPSYQVTGFLYNQERDAAGELDGASGKGTAVAAEYEYNGGGPGTANYDRARNLQGKGLQTAAVSSGGGTASTSMVLASVTGLTAGQQITLSGGSAVEVVYVAINYTVGNTTVPLQTGIANGTQTTATWSAFAAQGPDVNEYLIDGEGTEFISAYNPATKRGNLVTGVAGALNTSVGGRLTTAIAAAGSANVKAAPGRLARVLITVAGTASITFYDNAAGNSTGTIIGITPATTTIGTVYDFQTPALAGISAVGGAGSPGVTVSYY